MLTFLTSFILSLRCHGETTITAGRVVISLPDFQTLQHHTALSGLPVRVQMADAGALVEISPDTILRKASLSGCDKRKQGYLCHLQCLAPLTSPPITRLKSLEVPLCIITFA